MKKAICIILLGALTLPITAAAFGYPGISMRARTKYSPAITVNTVNNGYLDGRIPQAVDVYPNEAAPQDDGGDGGGEAAPEPATLVLMAMGLAGAGVFRRLKS